MPFRTPNVLLYERDHWADRESVGWMWLNVVGEDCKLLGITLQGADQLARNRLLWSRLVYRLFERADSLASSKN